MGAKNFWVCYLESNFSGNAQQRWNFKDCRKLSNDVRELMNRVLFSQTVQCVINVSRIEYDFYIQLA